MKNLVLKAFKNRIFSKNDLIAPTNLGGMNMVDLVGRRDSTYIKLGSHVFDCYHEEHDKSSFCWIYEILESAAHTPVHIPNPQRNSSCRRNNPHYQID
eukprot:Awhi_evm2s12847